MLLYLLRGANHYASIIKKKISPNKFMYVYIYISMYKYIYIEREGETERLTTSPTTAIRALAGMEVREEREGFGWGRGGERIGACNNVLSISLYFFFLFSFF